jgi:glycosyltransferase involved in cell wall biosynthesis
MHEPDRLADRLQDWQRAAPNFLRRQLKTLRQSRHGWVHRRRLGFVFGCQRSGTKMVMRVLDQSPDTRIFHENHASAFSDFQLRSERTVRALVALNPAPVQVFKPICDSQHADRILDQHQGSRGVWVFRHFDDVANSAVVKWDEHQRDLIQAVVDGDLETWGWRTARLPDEVVADIRRVAADDLSPHEAAALFWYMRNAFFFALELDRDPRVMLVRYADLVERPSPTFRELFDFLGAPFDEEHVAQVRGSSIGRRPPPELRPEIRALCEGLHERLCAWRPQPRPVPKSVMILIDTLYTGGAERYAITVANWFRAQGAHTVIVSSGGDQVGLLEEGVVHEQGPLYNVRANLLQVGAFVRELAKRHAPEAFITNSLATAMIARAAQGVRHIPIVNVAHGWPAEKYSTIAPLMRIADRVVAVSPEVRRKLIEGGCDAPRVRVVYNGVDCRPLGQRDGELRARCREEMGAGPDDVLVALVGRLEDQKAHQHVMSVAAQLQSSYPRLRIALIGGGSREDELLALRAELGVEDVVRMMGLRSDVADLLGSADLFFNCSDWEGMPLTTIEAMASGLAVVATATEGAAELLTPETGVVVPPADAPAMAQAIAALIDDDERRATMGAAARQRALDGFSHDRMARELALVVDSVLAG